MGGAEKGELLTLAAEAGFGGLLTLDKGLRYQQNMEKLPCAIIAVAAKSNEMEDLLPLLPAIVEAIGALKPRAFVRIPG